MAKNSDLKVLVLAEAANPEWTSVPLVGWSHTLALSRKVHVHLVTQVRNRAAIERFGWKHGREFTALNTEKVAAPIHKLANLIRGGSKLAWTVSTAFQSLIYPYFEYLCWKTFEKDLRAGKFDIVHRITPVSPTAPSYLAKRLKKIKIPFVVGPMNGGVEWPVQFREVKGKEKEWLTNFRDFYKVLPGYRSMRAASAALIAGSKATLAQLPAYTREKSLLIPENAIDPDRFSIQNQSTYALPLKAAFVGRLVPYKGADMAIEAMEPLLLAKKIEYDIYGAGPEENRLRQMVAAKGLTGSVRVHGQVPHTELQKFLAAADLFVFPSVREFGGGAVLEAMALGVVPVIVDYAGPAELVNESCGFKVKLGERDEVIAELRATLDQIISRPTQLATMRENCIRLVNQSFTWSAKADQMIEVYNWLLHGGKKPEFFH